MKKFIASLLMISISASAFAGTDTLVHFSNLSPYKATVNFTPGDNQCWYDDNADLDGRINEYFGYYKSGAAAKGFTDYVNGFNAAYGITDLATVPQYNMNTSTILAPATSTSKVSTAIFKGQTSAAIGLFNSDGLLGCKDRNSQRGFDVTLTQDDGTVLNKRHYVLMDPAGSQWTLSRNSLSNPGQFDSTITLGSGGSADPLEVGLLVASTVVTIYTIGTTAAHTAAARTIIVNVAREVGQQVTRKQMAKGLFVFAMRGTITPKNLVSFRGANFLDSGVARTLYASLAQGIFHVYASNKADSNVNDLNDGMKELMNVDYKDLNISFNSPTLMAASNLPDSRSICMYSTNTLGFLGLPECRVAGVSLSIMPDGSIVFVPMPGIGNQ